MESFLFVSIGIRSAEEGTSFVRHLSRGVILLLREIEPGFRNIHDALETGIPAEVRNSIHVNRCKKALDLSQFRLVVLRS